MLHNDEEEDYTPPAQHESRRTQSYEQYSQPHSKPSQEDYEQEFEQLEEDKDRQEMMNKGEKYTSEEQKPSSECLPS